MKVIALTGLPRSGKDTAAKYLSKKYGFKHFDIYRDALVPELKKRQWQVSKENATKLGIELRAKFGMAAPAELLLKKIGKKARKIVVTGFRSPAEVQAVKKKSDFFVLAEIQASEKLRFRRRKKAEGKTLKDFLWREQTEAKKMGLKKVLKLAKIKVKNSGSLKDLKMELDAFVEKNLP